MSLQSSRIAALPVGVALRGRRALYVTPDPEPGGARIWFFTRLGGVSRPPYDTLNVSRKVGDGEEAVAENLLRVREAMGDRPISWVRQVAGDGVVEVSEGGFAGEADALITSEPDLCLTVGVADCVPVALVGEGRVGMVHSGWRGTLAGISGKAARRMRGRGLRAYIGPSIRQCCYEVSPELARRFARRFGDAVVSGRQLSLPGAVRRDLEEAGVEEVVDLGLCTGCRPDLFFSHRKQKPVTGRSLAAVARIRR
ncbi:Polyphenol oxidase [Rubrobacter xylanophilus DSM 9941]|uniref:polyphenol oxidase family protein n=1 Tax=Rubrobacter xylanophilus TaxID=49319 RepID=UPI001C63C899|nr:polyphenol oxidase family protein [Rubrobacter xylanophilus]QYJ14723.1 Polyphenol oxidase [Rubrobacter xylanophilus DSM 9941]